MNTSENTTNVDAVVDQMEAALSAPPRNCDRFGWRDAWEKWRTENHPKKPVTYKEAYDSTAAFMDWFMGTAEKGGAA